MRIDLKSVSKRYAKVDALKNISFSVSAGQIVSLVGPNGAGKTTLLRCLGGIVVPSSGDIYLDGVKFRRGDMELRRRIAFLPDFPILYPHNTVLRHIGMVMRLYQVDTPAVEPRVISLLRSLDLMPLIDTPIANLSRGQAYKTGLAAFLAVDAELLVLDEPFASGMDPNGITFLKREARAMSRRGRTVIYSTQILDIAERLSDQVCIIDRGEVRRYASLAELQAEAAGQGGVLEELFQRLRETAP